MSDAELDSVTPALKLDEPFPAMGPDDPPPVLSWNTFQPVRTLEHDGFVPVQPGAEFFNIWGADRTEEFPDDGAMPEYHTYFPPVGGYRFEIVSLPPGMGLGLDGAPLVGTPGMHASASVDLILVISGVLGMELEDGARYELRPGDTVVQNGTQHAWYVPGSEPAVFAVFLVGATGSG